MFVGLRTHENSTINSDYRTTTNERHSTGGQGVVGSHPANPTFPSTRSLLPTWSQTFVIVVVRDLGGLLRTEIKDFWAFAVLALFAYLVQPDWITAGFAGRRRLKIARKTMVTVQFRTTSTYPAGLGVVSVRPYFQFRICAQVDSCEFSRGAHAR